MPVYTVKDTQSGKTIKFEWNGKQPPTDADMMEVFNSSKDFKPSRTTQPVSSIPQTNIDPLKDISPLPESNVNFPKIPESFGRPALETSGMVGGGLLGTEAGPIGSVIGAGLGYGIGKKAADWIYDRTTGSIRKELVKSAQDIGTGMTYEMLGQSAPVVIGKAAEIIGKVARPFLGRISGVGTSAIDEALKSASQSDLSINPIATKTTFDKALRGKLSGEDIVDNAKAALSSLKDQRQGAYQSQLAEISKTNPPIDPKPIKADLASLMGKYNVKIDVKGKIDTSRIAMGQKGRNDIRNIIQTVTSWGSKEGDNTALGLDVLKRQLDDFYSPSSQARQFVTSLRNSVKDAIVKNVPQYGEMTKGYAEATGLIKDIESGLMLRKQGMSGRIVADQTLRRLTSSMRDNFALRKELVDVLGSKTNQDLAAQTAGYTMRSVMPLGLAGTGPVLIAETIYARFFNPKFWPVLAASSPRVQAEFLRVFGQALSLTKGIPTPFIGPSLLRTNNVGETNGK